MIMKFHLEQTLEYIRLQVQYNIHLEVKIQALMEIEQCFPYPKNNHILCLWHLCLDNLPIYQTQYVIHNLLIQIPHQN